MGKYTWNIKTFEELSNIELYHIIQLREDVFIVEQNCPYLDADGKDLKSTHIFAMDENNTVVATSRLLPPGLSYSESSIGRVCNSKLHRGKKLGQIMMEKSVEYLISEYDSAIRISAQVYLDKFYSDLGFKATGKTYLEDGIPHMEMLYPNKL
jgi:ElaA protein